jgi:hypothetical protein
MPAATKALQSLGLLTVAFDGDTTRLSLTAKGQQYAVGAPYGWMGESGGRTSRVLTVDVVATTVEFGTITGITEDEGSKSARVEFTVIRKPTPFVIYSDFGSSWAPATIPRTVTFTKYDDGWRITGGD